MAKRKKNVHSAKQKPMQKSAKPIEKTNPFEFKVNRKKYDIVGQQTKTRFGFKNANKAKVNEKRRDFFKKIHLHKNKTNNFIDKRIGEYDSEMVNEDRVLARIAEDRRKKHKKSLYNLNDEFDLTHDGQPISGLDTFDDRREDTDEEDESQLDADFVSEAHFGGFLTKKDNSAPKTRREILNDFITESKKKKQERKEAREMTDGLTSELDAEWKQIHSMLPNSKDDAKKGQCDPFDVIVKELKFEPRATPAINVKNEALQNQQKMKKLEDEKVSRMRGDVSKPKRLSASVEAIEEDFELSSESSGEEEEVNGELRESELERCINPDFETNKTSNGDLHLENYVSEETSVPQTVEALLDLLSNLSPAEISIKLNSLIAKCRFKTKANVEISKRFFRVLLEYVDIIFKQDLDNIELFEVIAHQLYTLAQKSSLDTGNVYRTLLFEKIAFYNEVKQKKNFEFFNMLMHLKLCGSIYSTSDFHHPIAMPAMILMSDILNYPAHVTIPNIACRIFICNLMFDYVSYSKRYIPEAVNYLFSILILATNRESLLFNCINKSNLRILIAKKILQVTSNTENWEPVDAPLQWLKIVCCSHKHENNEILTIIYRVISLIYDFAKLYIHLPIFAELFRPASAFTSYLPTEFYPEVLVTLIEELKSFVTKEKPIQRLSISNKKPKLPKLFTPRLEDFTGKKPSGVLEKLKVHKELSKKIKKEEKGIIREFRRDAEFLAREQLHERIEADSQRKRKVKELYSQLAVQEGEYKKLSKKK